MFSVWLTGPFGTVWHLRRNPFPAGCPKALVLARNPGVKLFLHQPGPERAVRFPSLVLWETFLFKLLFSFFHRNLCLHNAIYFSTLVLARLSIALWTTDSGTEKQSSTSGNGKRAVIPASLSLPPAGFLTLLCLSVGPGSAAEMHGKQRKASQEKREPSFFIHFFFGNVTAQAGRHLSFNWPVSIRLLWDAEGEKGTERHCLV